MNKKERILFISTVLDKAFPNPKIPLMHKDPFTLLVAVVLSAQTTDKVVNQVTPTLFALANTPQKMATLSPEEIEKIISPCGLAPTKAKALSKLSQDLIEKYHGKVPKTFEELESLKGVGHKTASVVLSQAFNIPAFPVDTHIHRLAKRWKLSSGKSVLQTEKDLKKIFPQIEWQRRHLQMIYFGRTFCPARGHKKENCPICSKF